MSLSKREIFLLCILLICGIGYAYYTYAYEPLQNQLMAVRSENQALSREIDQLKQAGPAEDGEPSDSLHTIKQDFWAATNKVPTYPLVPESISFLETIGKDSGIDLKSLHISDPGTVQPGTNSGSPAAGNSLMTQNYELAGTGGYFAFNSFLMKLEESQRIYLISSINIGSQPVSNAVSTAAPSPVQVYDGSSLTFTMSMTSYYDGIELEDIGSSFETVQPTIGRNNPFSS